MSHKAPDVVGFTKKTKNLNTKCLEPKCSQAALVEMAEVQWCLTAHCGRQTCYCWMKLHESFVDLSCWSLSFLFRCTDAEEAGEAGGAVVMLQRVCLSNSVRQNWIQHCGCVDVGAIKSLWPHCRISL